MSGLFFAKQVSADFVANDKFWGYECTLYFMCQKVFLHAVDDGDGLHFIKRIYPENSVNEYNEKMGICHIQLKNYGILGKLSNINKPTFFTQYDDSLYRPVATDTLSFDCERK